MTVAFEDVKALQGQLLPTRTVQQTQSQESTGEAYVAEIKIKSASSVLKVLDSAFPRDPTLVTTHLRRFAKPGQLPSYLKPKEPEHQEKTEVSVPQTIFVLIPPPLPEISKLQTLLSPYVPSSSENELEPIVSIQSTRILLQPPTSVERAEFWSREYWPTTYNAASHPTAHSPSPYTLTSTQKLLEPEAGKYLALARRVANEAKELNRGRSVGAVAVDPALANFNSNSNIGGDDLRGVVAVAGDARYCEYPDRSPGSENDPDQESGPETHALMRLIAMIANKSVSESLKNDPTSADRSAIHSTPSLSLSPLESLFLSPLPSHEISSQEKEVQPSPSSDRITSDGDNYLDSDSGSSTGPYLCTSLDVYITHDPCPCCSMGMVLSRFHAVIYIRDESRIGLGGLASTGSSESLESGTGYGLNWRRELNWRTLGFEFIEDGKDGERSNTNLEGNFNA